MPRRKLRTRGVAITVALVIVALLTSVGGRADAAASIAVPACAAAPTGIAINCAANRTDGSPNPATVIGATVIDGIAHSPDFALSPIASYPDCRITPRAFDSNCTYDHAGAIVTGYVPGAAAGAGISYQEMRNETVQLVGPCVGTTYEDFDVFAPCSAHLEWNPLDITEPLAAIVTITTVYQHCFATCDSGQTDGTVSQVVIIGQTTAPTPKDGLTLSAITTSPTYPQPGEPFELDVAIRNDATTTATDIRPADLLRNPPAELHLGAGPTPTSVAGLAGGATTHFTYLLTADKAEQVDVTAQASGTVAGDTSTTKAQKRLIKIGAGISASLAGPATAAVAGEDVTVTLTVTNRTGDPTLVTTGALTADPPTGFTTSDAAPASATLADGATATFDYVVRSADVGARALSAGVTAHDTVDETDTTATTHTTLQVVGRSIVVTTTGDQALPSAARTASHCDVDPAAEGDQCTLRAAIQLANHRGEGGAITFDIPGAGVPRIVPASALPASTTPLSVDGTTQQARWVQVDGDAAGPVDGLHLTGAASAVRGLVVSGWSGIGIRVDGANTTIAGNRIGTTPSGTAAAPNGSGVLVDAPAATIGGTIGTSASSCTGDCNLISGNATTAGGAPTERSARHGVLVCAGGNGAHVIGSWIGVDVTGTAPLPNDRGVDINSGSFACGADPVASAPTDVLVGGSTSSPGAAPGNLISGNATGVVVWTGAGAHIAGNLIGTDPTGTLAVTDHLRNPVGVDASHLDPGVALTGVVVGGRTVGERNIISGHTVDPTLSTIRHLDSYDSNAGIPLHEVGAGVLGRATVIGNRIGTDITGTRAIPNDRGVAGAAVRDVTSPAPSVLDNLISGNGYGVVEGTSILEGDRGAFGAPFASVAGNRIGTTADGSAPLGNLVGVAASHVGGVRPVGDTACDGPCNLVSGNIFVGISGGTVLGNFVGTDLTGTRANANHPQADGDRPAYGAILGGVIGGPSGATTGVCDQACNLISGNATEYGIFLTGKTTGNVIGRSIDGHPLPNGAGVVSNHPGGTLGGDGPGEGNLIADNLHAAVVGDTGYDLEGLRDLQVHGNAITGNGAGITYGAWQASTGVTVLDNRPGHNREPALPVLDPATVSGGRATVTGYLSGFLGDVTQGSYRIDLYASPACESPTEGAIPLGHVESSLATFTMPTAIPANATVLTATVTNEHNTSRFSACAAISRVAPHAQLSSATATAGQQVAVSGVGFAPGEAVAVDLHSDVIHLATLTADATGSVNGTVTIPATTPAGDHHIFLTGATSAVEASTPIVVAAPPAAGPATVPTSTTTAAAAPAVAALPRTGADPGRLLLAATILVLIGVVFSTSATTLRRPQKSRPHGCDLS